MKVSPLVIAAAWMMTQPAWAAPVPSESDPPLEMLEFLGTWQMSDDKDIDPFDIDDGGDTTSSHDKSQRSSDNPESKEPPQHRFGRMQPKSKDTSQERLNR